MAGFDLNPTTDAVKFDFLDQDDDDIMLEYRRWSLYKMAIGYFLHSYTDANLWAQIRHCNIVTTTENAYKTIHVTVCQWLRTFGQTMSILA